MGTKLRRFLMLLAMVALLPCMLTVDVSAEQVEEPEVIVPVCYLRGDVNNDAQINVADALQVLYASLYPTEHAVNQNCDFNGSGAVDNDDAIYLLWASINGSLNETVHSYYDPEWSWTEDYSAATVTIRCGCGKEDKTLTATVTKVTTAPSCLENGADVYTAVAGDYTDERTVDIPATGHTMVGETTCTVGSACQYGDYEEQATGHNLVLNEKKSQAATCTAQAVQVYECACGYSESVTLEGTLEHTYAYLQDVAVTDTACKFVKQYKCATCDSIINGTADSDTYIKHEYTATLTTEANCQTAGVKTYTCKCGDSYTEAVAADTSKHVWNAGSEVDGVITYTCEKCSATKTAVSDTNSAGVSKTALADAGELALANNVAIQLDNEVMGQIADDATVKVSVGTVDVANLGLSEELKEQIGDNTVYDFSMVVNETAVSSFDGMVTVTLPYDLAEGEDVDSIGIWYINDQGVPAQIKNAVYSNGFVTFQTNHFSYYSVTRLTPGERCAIYGHIEVETSKAATCTTDGYDMVECQRCGRNVSKTIHKATGHSYTYEVVKATCEAAGTSTGVCSAEGCGHTVTQTLPALGHKMELVAAESKAASCTAAGVNVYACTHEGCDKTTQEALPQLEHNYQNEGEQKANCGSKGHKKKKCSMCGQEQTYDESAPTGHDYVNENAIWVWNEDYTEATVTLVCAYNTKHTKKLNAVVSIQYAQSPTCEKAGLVTYTATASFNKGIFTNTIEDVEVPALSHKADSKWHSDGEVHYHECQLCKQKIDSTAVAHTYGPQTVTQEATCALPGKAVETCTVCDRVNNVILPFTDEHIYNDSGICTGCGRDENTCSADAHKMLATEFELDDPDGDCTDGYWVTKKCEYCGYTEKTWGDTHEQHTTAQYALGDYDCCEDSMITLRRCACGAEMMPEFTGDCGVFSEMCQKCGGRAVPDMNGYKMEVISACLTKITIPTKLYNRDAEVKLEFTIEAIATSHRQQIHSVTFDKEGGTCEDGYSVEATCISCGAKESKHGDDHDEYVVEYVDIAEAGGCGGYIYRTQCPCGSDGYISTATDCEENYESGNSYVDDDGRYHSVSRYSCATCKLTYTSDYCSVQSGCKYTQYAAYEITLPNGTVKTLNNERTSLSHSNTYYIYELLPGSKTCLDGIIGYGYCKNCGAEWEGSKDTNYHAIGRNPEGDIDLAPYGAICGTKLEHHACACGEYQNYQLPNDDTCNIGTQSTDIWIPGALNVSDDINGYFSSYAYIYKCAVTDPVACGLTIRKAEYYLLEDGCIPTRKETWQLGYNELTGTFERELTVVPYSTTSTYHTYTTTETQETQADGTVVSTTLHHCPKCESSVKVMDYRLDGEQVKYIKETVNNLNNGAAKQNIEHKEYAYKFNGKRYMTLSRYEYTYADGRNNWNQEVCEYDFANTCRYTRTYTYGSGDTTSSTSVTELEHDLTYTYTDIRRSTCTQNGRYFNGNVCIICNHQGSGNYYDTMPSGHYWNYDSSRSIYVCSYCGLEGKNGADGSIVLEDLTASKGNGTNYVIGYWNKEMLAVTPKISVLLKDWDNDQRILNIDPTYWTISDHGVRAVVYNVEQVETAAKEAMASEGYTGSYAIRVSFVPDSGDTTLDFAITFDSLG